MNDTDTIQKVISICNKKPSERLPLEISTLVELTKTCKVFKSLIESNGNSSHIQCCKYLKYQYGHQGDYIFKYGENGTKFYIIISGLVSVEVPKKTLKGDFIFFEAISLSTGSSFGELALESSKPRAASIRCKQNSHFIYLEKQDYVQLISKIVQDKRDAAVNFLQSLPMFSSSTKGTLTKLTYGFKERIYNKGQIVYAEGDVAEEIFVVKKGEFEFFKIIKKFRRGSVALGVQAKEKFKHCKIANYCVGEMFGEEDAIRGQPRANTCKSLINDAVVMVICKNEFLRLVSTHSTIMDFINQRIEEKTRDFEKREEMLQYIENNPHKKEKKKSRKPLLCVDLERDSKCTIYHSVTPLSPKSSLIKTDNTSLTSFHRTQITKSKTFRTLEKFKLPEVFKLKHKNSIFSSQNSEKFLPASLNEKIFKATNGLSITSFNKSSSTASMFTRYDLSSRK